MINTMKTKRTLPYMQAILAAILFGASAPFAKLLLGEIDPIPLAAFLYLGSGLGALLLLLVQRAQLNNIRSEAKITRQDIPWLFGAVLAGGVLGPIILLFGLKTTPAGTASLLLNFESVATTLIAVILFREAISKRILAAIGLVTIASVLLSWNGSGGFGFSLGALGVLAACIFWGFDNNFTRNISGKNPLIIVAIKGLGAGTFSIILSLAFSSPFPAFQIIFLALLLGAFSYGLSIYFFILALRNLGSARTSSMFGIAPFVGTIISIAIFNEKPALLFWISLPLIIVGAFFMLSEDHSHTHLHLEIEHDHRHSHPDEHHFHSHTGDTEPVPGTHSHPHTHSRLEHAHGHTPDQHHRHEHK